MKRALLIFALFTSSAVGQTGSRVTLDLGPVTVWLGMDRAAAKQQLETAGMKFIPDESDTGRVQVLDQFAKRLYSLRFENNKVVFAERNWLSDEANALSSVMDALTSLADQAASRCTIQHDPINKPEGKLNRVFITCGPRAILMTFGTMTIGGQSYSDDTVEERIGAFEGATR